MTYSIVAARTSTREVGGAGTSCLGGQDVYVIYAASPGHGVVHAQAHYSLHAKSEAARLLGDGFAPADILAALTAPSFDGKTTTRQYGLVDVFGDAAGFTGAGTTAYAADAQGHFADYAYSVQGNILTSARVLEQSARAFTGSGCDLPERLMNALEAGALNGEGDSRCTEQGLPSDSAFLQVESPDMPLGGYLSLRVETSGDQSPLPLLRSKLDAWRATHACPQPASQVDEAEPSRGSSETGSCGCRTVGTEAQPGALLIGCCLVVAWSLRRRAARQLDPAHLAR
jgi:uncharacterized Ntn-hydrolase superfamily protein